MTRIADLRNIATIERLAKAILVQAGYYRRNTANGDEDGFRFALMNNLVLQMHKVTKSAYQRYEREREPA